MRSKEDLLWKVVLEEVFDDLLRFVFPAAGRLFDLKRGFEYLDKELAELNPIPYEKTKTRFADKLVKVYLKHGGAEWVLIHIEIQGKTNPETFAERMFRYFIRIYERYDKRVTALAIFTGPDARVMPARFDYDCLGTPLTYEYNRLSILDYSNRMLEESGNPFAVVLRVARAALPEGEPADAKRLLDEKILIARHLFAKGFTKQKIKAIFAFLEGYIRLKKPGMNRIFRRRIESHDKRNIMGIDEYLKQVGMEKGLTKGRKQGREEGIKKGIAKGRAEERKMFAQNLLSNTDFDNDKIAFLANLPSDYVQKERASMQGK